MLFSEFINRHNNKSIDYDGAAGVQCVDLVKAYLNEVFSIKPGSWGDARMYYERFNDTSWPGYSKMNSMFTRIANTPSFVPQQGDIVVWGKNISKTHDCGHIAIADSGSDTSVFYSYDQNWGSNKACHRVKHSYTAFLGVLRPRQRYSKVALNVRSGPGITKSKVNEIPANTRVIIKETSGSWSKIVVYNDTSIQGWVSTKYLTL